MCVVGTIMSGENQDVDRWIAHLEQCKPLTEGEVEQLCEKVSNLFSLFFFFFSFFFLSFFSSQPPFSPFSLLFLLLTLFPFPFSLSLPFSPFLSPSLSLLGQRSPHR